MLNLENSKKSSILAALSAVAEFTAFQLAPITFSQAKEQKRIRRMEKKQKWKLNEINYTKART